MAKKKTNDGLQGPSFIIGQKALKKSLATLGAVVNDKPILPILKTVKLDLLRENLRLTTSDLVFAMQQDTDVVNGGDFSFAVCVDYQLFHKLISTLADQPISIFVNTETYEINIQSESGVTSITGEEATNFPVVKHNAKLTPVDREFTAEQRLAFVHYLSKVKNSVAEANLSKDNLEGCCWQSTRLMGFDGLRMAWAKDQPDAGLITRGDKQVPAQYLLPVRGTEALIRLSESMDTTLPMALKITADRITFGIGSSQVSVRLLDEVFPPTDSFVFMPPTASWTVNRGQMIGMIKRMMLITNPVSKFITLSADQAQDQPQKLRVQTGDTDYKRESNEAIICEVMGHSHQIAVNGSFLLDALNTVDSVSVTLELNKTQPGLRVMGEDQNLILFLSANQL